MVLHASTLTRLLDEVERLRGVLGLVHANHCEVLRSGDRCTCACTAVPTSALVEIRAEVQTLKCTLLAQRAALVRLGALRGVPVTQASQFSRTVSTHIVYPQANENCSFIARSGFVHDF